MGDAPLKGTSHLTMREMVGAHTSISNANNLNVKRTTNLQIVIYPKKIKIQIVI